MPANVISYAPKDEPNLDASSVPLDQIDVSDWDLFVNDAHGPHFERLRNEDPVHYHTDSHYGPYWSVTRFQDIKEVDSNHELFSSDTNITIFDQPADFERRCSLPWIHHSTMSNARS